MLTYEAAVARMLRATPQPRVARVPLSRALRCVLASPVKARVDAPPFDNSAVDGYAVRLASGDAPAGGWHMIGESAAGHPFGGMVRAGDAVRILTGAPVPRGADTVLMQEHAARRDGRITPLRDPRHGQHIRRRGEDVGRGHCAVARGTLLRPQELGVLASLGCADVPVYAPPSVAILSTGDELTPPGRALRPGCIYESNGTLLSALVESCGARAVRLGIAPDESSALTARIRRGLRHDVLLISGGVSVGDKDMVRRVLERCGVTPVLWRVNIKPGMPLYVGRRGRTLVFGLPGNPVSVFVTFEEFVRPSLWKLLGRTWRERYVTPARLGEDLRLSVTRRTHFVRVRCVPRRGGLDVVPLSGQGSHQLSSAAAADGWLRISDDEGPWRRGASVLVKREREEVA